MEQITEAMIQRWVFRLQILDFAIAIAIDNFYFMNFIKSLETAFQKNSNPRNAFAMAKYVHNHFSFFGIKTEDRRLIF